MGILEAHLFNRIVSKFLYRQLECSCLDCHEISKVHWVSKHRNRAAWTAWWSWEHVYITVCICQTSEDLTASSVISLKAPVSNTLTYSNTDDFMPNSTLILFTQHTIQNIFLYSTRSLSEAELRFSVLTIYSVFTNLQERLFNSLKDLYFWIV